MLYPIIILLIALVAVFLAVVALRQPIFRVERSAAIDAPAVVVFEQVNDFRNWEAWSPWAKLDPNAKSNFEGPSSGVGSVFTWSGNNTVGAGRMEITESRPGELIKIKLDFHKPMKASNTAEFTFKPAGGRTTVTWVMIGKQNFVCRAFGLFMNMDKMVGGQFEKGLASIKGLSEAAVRR